MKRLPLTSLAAIAVAALAVAGIAPTWSAETTPVSRLAEHTHIHGLTVDRSDPSYLFIATHHGLYRAGPDGAAVLISEVQDFMGFSPHPNDPGMLYASGHPAGGGNLGFIGSTDDGRTWTQISPGLNGPVDFHQMTVSPVDPKRIYGAYRGLQVSRDGGKTWSLAGQLPAGLIDLAASAKSVDALYAATEQGLLVSVDAGKSWRAIVEGVPVTLVDVASDGTVYAFAFGRGFLRSTEPPQDFATLSADWGQRFMLHLAVDPTDPDRMFAATGEGEVLASGDGGKSWSPYGG